MSDGLHVVDSFFPFYLHTDYNRAVCERSSCYL